MALVKEFHGAGTGVLLKVEAAGTAGHEPIIRTEEDTLCMIPYHAVMTVSFAHPATSTSAPAQSPFCSRESTRASSPKRRN